MIKLEIVTPERRVVDAEVDSVTVPTVSGEAGIMPHHAPLISALRPGVLSYAVKGTSEKIAVSSGFVEVSSDKVSVLVDQADTSADIDRSAARSELEEAERALSSAGQIELDEAQPLRDRIDLAQARVAVAAN